MKITLEGNGCLNLHSTACFVRCLRLQQIEILRVQGQSIYEVSSLVNSGGDIGICVVRYQGAGVDGLVWIANGRQVREYWLQQGRR